MTNPRPNNIFDKRTQPRLKKRKTPDKKEQKTEHKKDSAQRNGKFILPSGLTFQSDVPRSTCATICYDPDPKFLLRVAPG